MIESKPAAYRFWPKSAQDRFDERIAIMREANNIPDSQATPTEIIGVAIKAAEDEVASISAGQTGQKLLFSIK